MNKKCNFTIYENLFLLIILSLGFGTFSIDTFFSIKPYMIISIIIYITFILKKAKIIKKIKLFELCYIFFIVVCSLMLPFATDSSYALKYILGMFVMLLCYFANRILLQYISKERIIDIINNVGILLSILNIFYYLFGIISINFRFQGNGIREYGVLLDRNIPRLISFASEDPNITAFIFTIFVFFFLLDIKKKKNKIGLLLSIILILLTISRGAYLAFVVTFLISFFVKNKFDLKIMIPKLLKIGLIVILVGFVINFITSGVLLDLIKIRVISSSSDGGSGRKVLWQNAYSIFEKNPFLGIGLNNLFLELKNVYVHNSLLQVLVETGIIGFSIYFVFLCDILFVSYTIYKNKRDNYIFMCITICMFIQMLFLSILIQETFFIYLAILYRFSTSKMEE